MRHAGDGRLAIDNNVAERTLRTIAISFLFLGCERAAPLDGAGERYAGRPRSRSPEAHLADMIDRLASGHPVSHLAERSPGTPAHPD